MEKNTNKKSASALIGAAFLMATSAIGPGFLTQTGQFTGNRMESLMRIRYAWPGCC